MTDRELLELAAKAAGMEPACWAPSGAMIVREPGGGADSTLGREWHPLTDDGDALRLAVQLGLEVSFLGDDDEGTDSQCCIGYPSSTERPCKISYLFEDHKGDIFAATRHAIVRAAAEIGMNYQSDSN